MKKLSIIMVIILIAAIFTSCSMGVDSSYAEAPAVEAYAYANTQTAAEADVYYEEEVTYSEDAVDMSYDEQAAYTDDASGGMQVSTGDVTNTAEQNTGSRKIIYTSSVEMQTLEFGTTNDALMQKVEELGGYISNTYSENPPQSAQMTDEYYEYYDEYYGGYYGSSRGYASYTIRVPVENYKQFMQSVGDIGHVQYVHENTEDVTLEYVDIESRLKSLRTQEEALLTMMGESEDVETLLLVQAQLAEVQYQIESFTARQRTLDDLIDYCTITVDIYEVERYTPQEQVTFATRVTDAISASAYNFVDGAQDFLIDFIYALPGLVILAIIIFIVVLIVKKIVKKNNKRRDELQKAFIKQQNEMAQGSAMQNSTGTDSGTEPKENLDDK